MVLALTLLIPTTAIADPQEVEDSANPLQVQKVLTLDDKLLILSKEYQVSFKIAKAIIWCESRNNPNARYKNLRNGKLWSTDVGYWQLNDYYWGDFFLKKGLDIHIPEQNLEAGFILLREKGPQPWYPSNKCHGLTG